MPPRKRRRVDSFSVTESECESENETIIETDPESESDSDFDIDIESYIQSFNFKLRSWTVKFNINLVALTFLLKLLREQGFSHLPKDARTLLQTPKTVPVTNIGPNKFWYRSLIDKLKELCKIKNFPKNLELGIHIDGFPPFVSSKLEFWPIQCWIKGVVMKPFIIGLHFGSSKPTSIELFLRPLLNELHELLHAGLNVKLNGFVKNYPVKVYQWILDRPARSLLKCIIGHSGYYSCERCEEEGVYLCQPDKDGKKKKRSGHVCLVGTDAPLRTNETFRNRKQEEHHTGITKIIIKNSELFFNRIVLDTPSFC